MRKAMALVMGISVFLLLARAYPEAADSTNFDPKDPKVQDMTIVNDALDTFITHKDRANAERVKAFTSTTAPASMPYCSWLISSMRLTMDKLEIMRRTSPDRWAVLQNYLNRSLAWLALAMKAEKVVGGSLVGDLKKELGEN